jgi:ribosome-binding protein aMBF1 (putative translation factor)
MTEFIEDPLISRFVADYALAKKAFDEHERALEGLMDKLPDYMKQYRKLNKRMTQAQLAERLVVDHSYISRVEGQSRVPSNEFVARFYQLVTETNEEPG